MISRNKLEGPPFMLTVVLYPRQMRHMLRCFSLVDKVAQSALPFLLFAAKDVRGKCNGRATGPESRKSEQIDWAEAHAAH